MTGISVKFRPGKDDDIKEWWDNEPDRAYLVRQWIREKLTEEVVPPSLPSSTPPKKQLKKIEGEDTGTDLMSQF